MSSRQQKIIANKMGLLRLAEELGNVSRACKVMGYSRDTFYRYKAAVDEGGLQGLLDTNRAGRPNFRNRTAPEIEEAVVQMAVEQPAFGQTRVSNELRKRGLQPLSIRRAKRLDAPRLGNQEEALGRARKKRSPRRASC
jgi:hypothetical protein